MGDGFFQRGSRTRVGNTHAVLNDESFAAAQTQHETAPTQAIERGASHAEKRRMPGVGVDDYLAIQQTRTGISDVSRETAPLA